MTYPVYSPNLYHCHFCRRLVFPAESKKRNFEIILRFLLNNDFLEFIFKNLDYQNLWFG